MHLDHLACGVRSLNRVSGFSGQLRESCLIEGTTTYATFSIISIQYLWMGCQMNFSKKMNKRRAGKKILFDFLTKGKNLGGERAR
jgi:hypothetical protein